MSRLPVITGFGGINAAGRSSFHHAFKRMVIDQLSSDDQSDTYLGLATLMQLVRFDAGQYKDKDNNVLSPEQIKTQFGTYIQQNTLLRKINKEFFDVNAMPFHQQANIKANSAPVEFKIRNRHLPKDIPSSWHVSALNDQESLVTIADACDILIPDNKASLVSTAAQLPTGMLPDSLYASRHHPRGLQMTVFAASDAIRSVGIDWDIIRNKVAPDKIAVYASSSMGQLDDNGTGGLIKAPGFGKRATSKQLPLGFAEMPADFVNAYIIGSAGATGGMVGACATFLYNLEHAVRDIQSGKRRVAIVGAAEAPITAEVIEGYRTMGALAQDADLLELDKDKNLSEPDYHRACRPFGYNCGFTIGESAQFVVLFDDALALELGAPIHGAVPDVYINADGYKKSISSPGIGNYLTMAKAASLAAQLVGEQALKHKSFVHAHGTGTPQNRTTESHVFNEVAKAFDIDNWLISSIKCYVGHSLGAAAGDQLIAALGTWAHGYVPGIFTLDEIANDVNDSNLRLEQHHTEVGNTGMDVSLLNSKGFGGNNATAVVLAPHVTQRMLEKRHGAGALKAYQENHEAVARQNAEYAQQATQGTAVPIYQFGEGVLNGEDLIINRDNIQIPGYQQAVDLMIENPYQDLDIAND